ncbi:efflux RND transporter periplasmic adaptor subunit [Parasalinivibrio latis]|uniref:efflux RND transporter periplasmic adaptor subunit n=1 Tax=Parasalinivibrio latis TaxID=2952610 RepID=UPI0030E377ED
MKKWFFIMALVVLLLFGSVIGFNLFKQHKIAEYLANRPEPEFPVTVTDVKAGDWNPVIEAIGFIEPNQGVTLTSEVSGTIKNIGFESGQKVEKGDLLVGIDSDVEKANLESTQARLPAAKAKFERYKDLFAKGSVSQEALDDAQASYLSLMAQVKSLKESIARRNITAPFGGEVGLRNVFLGQFVQPGTDIVRLEDTSVMRFRFTVPQTDLPKLRLGQSLVIDVDAYPDIKFDGNITAIEPAVNYQSGLVQVQASIPNNEGKLRSGMFARAKVILPPVRNQIILPQTAITFSLYGDTVYVVRKDDDGALRAFQTVVNTGERQGDTVHVLKGLEPGQTVVTSGQIRLSNHAKVKEVVNNALATPAVTPKL